MWVYGAPASISMSVKYCLEFSYLSLFDTRKRIDNLTLLADG